MKLRLAAIGAFVALLTVSVWASVSDDFNRANGALGANWTDQAIGGGGEVVQIVSNAISGSVGGPAVAASYYSGTAFGNDQSAQLTITVGPGMFSHIGPTVRASGTGGSATFYYLDYYPANPSMALKKRVGGSLSTIQDFFSVTLTDGDVIKISVSGSTLHAYLNGGELGSGYSDGDLSSGFPGVHTNGYDTSFRADDFLATGDGGGGGGGTMPPRLTLLGVGELFQRWWH